MILAPHFFASSGRISGSGFDSAKMIGSEFIVFTSSAEMRFGLLTPINTSAPTRASLREPLHWLRLVSARGCLYVLRSVLPWWIQPFESVITRCFAPKSCNNEAIASPAAPAQAITILRVQISFFVILSALISPASTTIAVPCWSSWKTGISNLFLSCSSI